MISNQILTYWMPIILIMLDIPGTYPYIAISKVDSKDYYCKHNLTLDNFSGPLNSEAFSKMVNPQWNLISCLDDKKRSCGTSKLKCNAVACFVEINSIPFAKIMTFQLESIMALQI